MEDSALWQFQPTVVHGSLSPESFLVAGDVVTGVLGWSQLQVGDPAADLFWLSSAPSEMVATRVFGSYNLARSTPVDRQLRKRARLYAELEIAKWLLHGAEKRDDTIMADAKTMLAYLSVSVESDMLNPSLPTRARSWPSKRSRRCFAAPPRRSDPGARPRERERNLGGLTRCSSFLRQNGQSSSSCCSESSSVGATMASSATK